jgi:hypothetical protein
MPIHDRLPIIKHSNRPLLRLRNITNIIELYPFFHCLTRMHTYDYQHPLTSQTSLTNKPVSLPKPKESSKKKTRSLIHLLSYRKSDSRTTNSIKEETMSEIETSVLEDFVESWI